jgi:hypothetical protein
MCKYLLLCAIFMTFNIGVYAQVTQSLTLGPDLGVPTKNFGKANLGFGGSFQYRLKFAGPVAIQLPEGYVHFTSLTSAPLSCFLFMW